MEKIVRPCDKEYMRMTMLKHQDTFKEQVYELHRLYKIQKILMKNMEASIESDGDQVLEIINESEIELTLGPSSYNRKKMETSLTSDSAHSLSSSSSGSNLINKTILKIPHSSHSTMEELNGGMIGLVQVPQSGIRNSYDIEEQSRQESSKQPPWFFQVLSLNTT
uniref:Uncharacterized protein n=1 Tax=Cajanus cajan TaxID=3821 RepID=A0A151SC98_CAJCA|nr:hypothetical protein KK1_025711 [Cajanus cajan]